MAEEKTQKIEREYVIPIRKYLIHKANYRKSGLALKVIKKFIAKHMKVPERDLSKVKVDTLLNQEIWFRGRRSPPARIKVKAIKTGDLVKVELAEIPKQIKFAEAKKEKYHKPAEEKKESPKSEESQEKKEQKTEEQKENEKEKEIATAEQHAKEAKAQTQAQKHVTKVDKASHPTRMALKK